MDTLFGLLHSIEFLAFCILSVTIFTGFLFYRRIQVFESLDPPPKIHYVIPKQLTTKKGPAVPVKAGLFIDEFLTFNLLTNRFVIEGSVWFIFNPSLIDLDIISRFSFDNGELLLSRGHSTPEPETKFIGDNLFVQYKIKLEFSSHLNFRAFPVDDHRLYIVLRNEFFLPEEIIFDVSETGLRWSENLYFSEWKVTNSGVEAGYKQNQLHKHIPQTTVSFPCVVFFLDLSRKGMRKALIIVLPIIFIFFVSFTSLIFIHKTELPLIIGTNTGSITGLIAYRFVVETISPNTGYFTITDHIFTTFLVFTFLNFIVVSYLYISDLNPFSRMIAVGYMMIGPLLLCATLYFVIGRYAKRKV